MLGTASSHPQCVPGGLPLAGWALCVCDTPPLPCFLPASLGKPFQGGVPSCPQSTVGLWVGGSLGEQA